MAKAGSCQLLLLSADPLSNMQPTKHDMLDKKCSQATTSFEALTHKWYAKLHKTCQAATAADHASAAKYRPRMLAQHAQHSSVSSEQQQPNQHTVPRRLLQNHDSQQDLSTLTAPLLQDTSKQHAGDTASPAQDSTAQDPCKPMISAHYPSTDTSSMKVDSSMPSTEGAHSAWHARTHAHCARTGSSSALGPYTSLLSTDPAWGVSTHADGPVTSTCSFSWDSSAQDLGPAWDSAWEVSTVAHCAHMGKSSSSSPDTAPCRTMQGISTHHMRYRPCKTQDDTGFILQDSSQSQQHPMQAAPFRRQERRTGSWLTSCFGCFSTPPVNEEPLCGNGLGSCCFNSSDIPAHHNYQLDMKVNSSHKRKFVLSSGPASTPLVGSSNAQPSTQHRSLLSAFSSLFSRDSRATVSNQAQC